MKKLLSLLLVLLLCVSAMPSVGLATDTTTDTYIFTREATPSTNPGLENNSKNDQVLTVASDADGEEYFLYTKKTTTPGYLNYVDHMVSMVYEMTFMLTSATSKVTFVPAFYDPNKKDKDGNTAPGVNWTSILTVSQNDGVAVTNIADGTGVNLFTKSETGWIGNTFKLIPNVTLNTKHTIRLEHNPETEKFTVWFDSYKVVLNENANGAWVEATKAESTVASGSKDGRIAGHRFGFAGNEGDTIKVYRYYIRGTQEGNTSPETALKVFTDAEAYTYANNDATNPFRYYIDTDGNAVITGFKYGVAPTGDYTQEAPLVFPNTLENKPVTKIDDYAFCVNDDGYKFEAGYNSGSGYRVWENIKAIKLPNTLKTIGVNSMRGFKSVTAVEIPDSVESVGESAFAYLDAATKLDFGNSLMTIGKTAFSYFGKSNFELIVPESVQNIGAQAFTNSKMSIVVFEGAPTTVGTYMFRNNPSLDKVVFLKDMILGDYFFGGRKEDAKNPVTVENKFTVIGSSTMLERVKSNMTAAEFTANDFTDNISYEDIFVYKSSSTPSVYYWGTDKDATLIKAQYNKTTNELESCASVTMEPGNNYPLQLGDGTYKVKNMFWSMDDYKPLIAPIEY